MLVSETNAYFILKIAIHLLRKMYFYLYTMREQKQTVNKNQLKTCNVLHNGQW